MRQERKRMLEKCLRKYSPTNCAVSSRILFKQVFSDCQPDTRTEFPTIKRRPKALDMGKEGKWEVVERRFQTPDFPGRGKQDRDIIQVKDRDFTLKSLKVGRSLTPDSQTPTTQYTSRPLFSTTPRKSSHNVSVPTVSSGDISREDMKGIGPNTQLSSEAASPVLEPRYYPEPILITRTPHRSPMRKNLRTLLKEYEEISLPAQESPHNKEFFLRPHHEVRNFLEFLPEMPGERLKFTTVTNYLRAKKYISNGEFIEKDAISKCVSQKADTSIYISKRFGKPKIWHYTGRAISTRFESELRSYWH